MSENASGRGLWAGRGIQGGQLQVLWRRQGFGMASSNSNPPQLSCSWLLSREESVTTCGMKTRSSLFDFGARTKGNKEGEGQWWDGFTVCVLSSIISIPFKKRFFFLLLCLHCCHYWLLVHSFMVMLLFLLPIRTARLSRAVSCFQPCTAVNPQEEAKL